MNKLLLKKNKETNEKKKGYRTYPAMHLKLWEDGIIIDHHLSMLPY
jgi:hypothetical protein